MIKPSKLLKLSPDLYSRNKLYSEMIRKLFPSDQAKLLEVGGCNSRLSWFLPTNIKNYVLDQKPNPNPESTIDYIEADALNIPFSADLFDCVLTSDTYEHIPSQDRLKFLSELFRVSKRFVIIAAPFKNFLINKAETLINNHYKTIHQADHPFLGEHLSYILPDEKSLEKHLTDAGYNFQKIREGNLNNWMLTQLATINLPESDLQPFKEFCNRNLEFLGNLRSPTYRTIYLIDKQNLIPPDFTNSIIAKFNNFKPSLLLEAQQLAHPKPIISQSSPENSAQIAILNREIQQLTSTTQTLINQNQQLTEQNHRLTQSNQLLNSEIKATTQQILLKDNHLKSIQTQLSNLHKALNERNLDLSQKHEELLSLREEKANLSATVNLYEQQISSQDNLLKNLRQELNILTEEKEKHLKLIVQKEHNIFTLRAEINDKNLRLTETERELNSYRNSLHEIFASRSWKLISIYSKFKQKFILKPQKILKRAWKILTKLGPTAFFKRSYRFIFRRFRREDFNAYHLSVQKNLINLPTEKEVKKAIQHFIYTPTISIILPVYNPNLNHLKTAIESVKRQSYTKWQLCIADDFSTVPEIRKYLQTLEKDKRIKVIFRRQNGGIVKATNTALKQANGAYITFLDNDDELTPDALFEAIQTLQEKKYDIIYSDSDKIDQDGTYCEPFYKPDFSPDLLLSCNYIAQLCFYRKKLLDEIGPLREGYDGSQDYDLILRATDKPRLIKHIPKVLYHWRKTENSTALRLDNKPYVIEASRKALKDTIRRRQIKAEVLDGLWLNSFRVKRQIKSEPLISIIIPFRDQVEILKKCIDSIFEKTTYKNYEILLINNQSELLDTIEYMKEVENCPRVRLLHYDAPFNYSAINNFASTQSEGEYLVLLNNDTEIISPDWLESMLEHASRKEVGAVGAKLLYPNNLIQHAGVLVGVGGVANCAFMNKDLYDNGYFGFVNVIRNYSAVTAACLMIKKETFERINGLDEENLAVTFNDIDLCLRLRELGYLIVYTPYSILYHHESLTRGKEVNINEITYMQRRHSKILHIGDPYYNPNLSSERPDYSLKIFDTIKE